MIVLVQGGLGSEREISLKTGAAFERALKNLKANYTVIDAKEDFPVQISKIKNIKCALLALHGKYGEDGTIQGILEYLKIPYTGSGVMASALAMNKAATKQILSQNGIPNADYGVINLNFLKESDINSELQKIVKKVGIPLVVKPLQEGSSVGMSIVKNEKDVLNAIHLAAKYDKQILIEKFISGMEITVPIWFGKALPIIEIKPKSEFYDYKRKYTKGETDYILPAPLSPELQKKCEKYSIDTFLAVGCRHYARVDLMISEDHKPYVLEINTLPGCTETSLLPKSAAKAGLKFDDMIQTLIENATLDYA
ncbi:MAG: D-alanine--D-alanine ligase [Oligoflexia bacterium]|nr:D-alanine--D-alanine ligase [Oligoflexia bacterium]